MRYWIVTHLLDKEELTVLSLALTYANLTIEGHIEQNVFGIAMTKYHPLAKSLQVTVDKRLQELRNDPITGGLC